MIDNKKGLTCFIKRVEKKFKKYFVAYGVREYKNNYYVNIMIDDRDVIKMEKKDLRMRINATLKSFLKNAQYKIRAKAILISDLNELNLWNKLGEYAVLLNVKALSYFMSLKFPKHFLKVYKKLPKEFKLSNFVNETTKISKKTYHRNTYQNWLRSLMNAGFLKLKNKTYHKIEGPYKRTLLTNLKT